jgi:limonene-1,2-epoxide hydrolase
MRRIAFLVILLVAALAGCNGGEDEGDSAPPPQTPRGAEIPGGADEAAVDVIYAWSEALRRGDIDAAAASFAIPSVAENGPLLVHIDSEAEARLFNESLPCGGRLIRARSEGEFTTATFRLTERPGSGSCGDGTGNTAQAAFVIRDGKIVEWRRVGASPPTAPGQAV